MTHYTILDVEKIKTLVSNYDVGKVISCEVLTGGSENTNYLIDTESDKHVLTICEQKSVEEAIDLTKLLEYLAINGFSTSKIVRTRNNDLIHRYKGKPVILRTFLEGKIMNNFSNDLLRLLGIQLGKLHKIDAPDYVSKELNYGKESFNEVEIYAANSSFHIWLNDVEKFIDTYISPEIPKSLIHSDVFSSNLVVDKDENGITIMDFEEATYYYRVFDIGMTIVGVCSEGTALNMDKVKSLLNGYQQEINLHPVETKVLQAFTVYAAAAMCFWRHKNYNYTNPTPEMKNHYLELKSIADHVRNLPEDCIENLIKKEG